MGRRDRERKERIQRGEELSFREKQETQEQQLLGNAIRNGISSVTRGALSVVSRKGIIAELSKGTTTEQVGKLHELSNEGVLPASNLRKALMNNAPKEMDKAIRKFRAQGKEITIDSLLEESRNTPGFLKMCESAGPSYAWFENLARERMSALGVRAE